MVKKTSSPPSIQDIANAEYLRAALKRMGREASVDEVRVAELTEGRQSNKVLSLKSKSAGAYVLKTFPLPNWRDAIFGAGNGELALWHAGVTRTLPAPLHCPTIDIVHNSARNEEWMLMEDVSPGIMARGVYDEKRLKWLLAGLATLHAHYWQHEVLDSLPVISLETHVAYFAEPITVLGDRGAASGWVKDSLENVTVFKPFVPVFLEVLGTDANYYLDLCEHRESWLPTLAKFPQTFIHGDIRRANVALIAEDNVSLFDWDMASRSPAACDLAWFWFLHFWCYPPKDGLDIEDREHLREYYIENLSRLLGQRFERTEFERSWDLSWLKSFMQLGFCLVDPLMSPHDADTLKAVRKSVRRALENARRISARYLL